jgi:hypothetical protein
VIIFTSNTDGKGLEKVKSLGMGIMIASSGSWNGQNKGWKEVPCALDNGAFQCWRRGFPFMADVFREAIDKSYATGLSLEFIVAPDIVAGGKASLEFSMEWAHGELKTAPRLALAVQDGMTPKDIIYSDAQHRFSHIFVGGTLEWKWNTAQEWVAFAHDHGMKAHIGRCGQLHHLRRAQEIGADSVDSASIVRNQSWHIVEEFLAMPHQLTLETHGQQTIAGSEEEDSNGGDSESHQVLKDHP